MSDIVDPETRSRMMSRIRGRDTRPEIGLRRALHARGLRYRLHDRRLSGRPDIVFPRFRAACFVHGCFWHRHAGCRYATTPATRRAFWAAKFEANVARDARNRVELHAVGWRVAVVWECALRHEGNEAVAAAVHEWLLGTAAEYDSGLGTASDGGRRTRQPRSA